MKHASASVEEGVRLITHKCGVEFTFGYLRMSQSSDSLFQLFAVL